MKITKHLIISGRVQGVGFQHFTRVNANELGVCGWVKNLPDRRVEAVFQGSGEKVVELIRRIAKGPVYGKVAEIEENEISAGEFKNFEVRY